MSGDPTRLLRLRGPVSGYPFEPSNEELAASVGLPVERIARYDMNTLGDGPLPAVREAWRAWDPAKAVEYGDPGLSAIATDSVFDSVRDDPRWLPFLRKIGKAPEQLDAIEFDVKVP